ncbi:MAG TPA: hypothetical protein DEA90_12300 [Opitutae bacterium]|nr:hypothetical protein [Puniceicoccaceae bacterium]HBR94933.1 hypothetical protein [Opitutae bacterium]
MKIQNLGLFLITLLIPAMCFAGESSRGTVIMISGVSGWLVVSSGFILWKEIKRGKHNRDGK